MSENSDNSAIVDDDTESEFIVLLRKILGSCNISFLFGAGVNGGAFPAFNSFNKTMNIISQYGLEGNGIEEALRKCADDSIRDIIRDSFVQEFNTYNDYLLSHPSLNNLKTLLQLSHEAVARAENRHPESKRINIFTLNYDRIVEELLDTEGFFSYALKRDRRSQLPFNVVGYNTETHSFVPTFAVYKLHGSVNSDRVLCGDDIVFPGQDKLGNVISGFYETLFAMKSELLRTNAALFVLGYSWGDKHINDVIASSIDNGSTVVFPQYKSNSKVPESLAGRVLVIPPGDTECPCDTTETLAKLFKRAIR